ncbi:hypothetical protein KIN20_030361 [Parelaphostrongylus tenuis]|uniref:Protein RFT1 homolog n=1 Tax=Parelaphostrongylus tenuis TaxID=148309 RepID=A0AAD5R3M6_PARTN|nr:hypothetical protein KIN20_030361 [Parelaphostrongylus tenuis]
MALPIDKPYVERFLYIVMVSIRVRSWCSMACLSGISSFNSHRIISGAVAVISLRFSQTSHFAVSQSLLVFLQRVFVLALITSTSMSHLNMFAYAQVLSSTAYLLFHYLAFLHYSRCSIPELLPFDGFRSFFPQPSHGIDREALSSLCTLFGHSILKQLMTDGSAYVMTFTELLSLKSQAVYDAVEKVGSLVARIILAPMEEMCFAYFSNTIRQNSKSSTKVRTHTNH